MAERDPKKLKKFQKLIDDIRKVSPTYGPMDFTTGGSSANHRPELRKKKGGKGALDLSFRGNDIKSKQDKINIGKVIKDSGFRVGIDSDHLHMDDRESPARVFTEDNSRESKEIKAALLEEQQRRMQSLAAELDNISTGTIVSQTPAGKAIANEEINNNPLLNEEQKDEAKKQLNNPQELINNYLANKAKKRSGEKPSVKNQFMEALTFFLPNIAGLATGALIGGTEGAIVGEEKGGQLGTAFRDYKIKQQELAAKDAFTEEDKLDLQIKAAQFQQKEDAAKLKKDKPKMDITPDFEHKETGEPVFTKEVDGLPKFINSRGEEIPSTQVRSIQDRLAQRRQEAISERQEKGFNEREIKNIISNKNVFVKDRAAPEIDSLKQVKSLKDLMASNTNITGLIEFKMAKGIAQEVGNLTSDERQVAASIVGYKGDINRIQEYLTSKMGSMRKKEINKLTDFIEPRIKDKIILNAMKHAKSAAKRLNVDPVEYVQELLDETGLSFPMYEKASQLANKYSKSDKYKDVSKTELIEIILEELRAVNRGKR